MSIKSDEYQTPKIYVDAARLVMGSIDLDPASSEINNKRLKVPISYTKETNGLKQRWFGNVWLNPPYSKPNLTLFTNKLLQEYGVFYNAIYLVPSFTAEKWYQQCLKQVTAICLPNKRIDFLLNGVYQTAPRFSNTFFYFGNNVRAMEFCHVFSKFGFVKMI